MENENCFIILPLITAIRFCFLRKVICSSTLVDKELSCGEVLKIRMCCHFSFCAIFVNKSEIHVRIQV